MFGRVVLGVDHGMGIVLLTWELGGGAGHLVNLLPLAKGLAATGHRVFAALRDLSQVNRVFAGIEVSYLQAPHKTRNSGNAVDTPRSFPHILHNAGFADADELRTMVNAWRNLFDYVRPDLIVFDHAPTALVAARGLPARKALIGTGFFCPPDFYPMPDLRTWLPDESARLRADEDRVLANVNQALDALGQPPLDRLAQLYHPVDENFLTTFPDLDNYPGRSGAEYWGAWPNIGGKPPAWPQGEGKRIYAYLKPFPALPRLLATLAELRCPTIVCVDGVDERLRRRFTTPTLRFETERLDLAEVGRQCDLAVLNGNHGTTVSMLLAGKPILQLPIFLDQALNAKAVSGLGAGLGASPERAEQIAVRLLTILHSDKFSAAARAFAARYADFDPQRQKAKMLDHIEKLLAQSD